MTDVLLINENDGGNIAVNDGIMQMTNGFETAVYLSLFGGNLDDCDYWANSDERDIERKQVSQFQQLVISTPLTSNSIRTLTEAIKNDLSWMQKYVSDLTIDLRIPEPKRLSVVIDFVFNGAPVTLIYTQNWEVN